MAKDVSPQVRGPKTGAIKRVSSSFSEEPILIGSARNQDQLQAREEFELYRSVVQTLAQRLDDVVATELLLRHGMCLLEISRDSRAPPASRIPLNRSDGGPISREPVER